MKSRALETLAPVLLGLALSACGDEDAQVSAAGAGADASGQSGPTASAQPAVTEQTGTPPPRWYSSEHVRRGADVYARHCATCHGDSGQGTPDWRQRGPDGSFPPPPLNGSAHTWHHPLRALAFQLKFGTPGGGGKMPSFAATLSDAEIIDVIAWFQSMWPDGIYATWYGINERSSE